MPLLLNLVALRILCALSGGKREPLEARQLLHPSTLLPAELTSPFTSSLEASWRRADGDRWQKWLCQMLSGVPCETAARALTVLRPARIRSKPSLRPVTTVLPVFHDDERRAARWTVVSVPGPSECQCRAQIDPRGRDIVDVMEDERC